MRCSVLVVDDEHYLVDLIAVLLEEEGFAVIRAYDGLQAIRAIRRRMPDLVIADIKMPEMDGIALARVLRARQDPVPVILMSASRRELNDFDCQFIPKPFDLDHLVTMAHEMTGGPMVADAPVHVRSSGQERQISAGD